MSEAAQMTFEDGYRRLQEIAERLNSDEVPVHEMCDLFAEGEGLKAALSDYLQDRRQRVEEIKRGEGVQRFDIVAPSDPDGEASVPADTADPEGDQIAGDSDDEIPF